MKKQNGLIKLTLWGLNIFHYFFILNSCLLYAQDINKVENIISSKQFTVASSNNFPPMNMLDDNGNLIGFGRELSDAVVQSIGGTTKRLHSPVWVNVLEYLDSDKADFIHDTGYTKDRDKFLDYSDPIIEMPEVIFVRSDRYDIISFDSLKHKKVGCINKHITHLYLQQFSEIQCVIVETPIQGVLDLISKKTDAFIYPKQIVLYLTQNLRLEDKVKITGEELRTLSWSMVVKEGNKELLSQLNQGLVKVKESGEYDSIYNKWFGQRLLFGYSIHDLVIITITITGLSVTLVLLVGFFLYSLRMRRSKKQIEMVNQDLKSEIAERKQAQKAFREGEEKYRVLFHSVPLGITVSDKAGNILETNTISENLLGVSKSTHSQRTIDGEEWKIVRPDGTLMPNEEYASVRALEDNCMVENVEMGIVKAGNQITWINVTATPIPSEKYGVLVVYGDITNRKLAETKIKASLKEKETLLQEVHHRVKNNMQVITSLLQLQSNNIENNQIKEALKGSQSRVYAMSAVHEMLHGSENLSEIDLKSYLSKITTSIYQTYSADHKKVKLNSNVENIPINLNQAYPLGLIINELISNSLKYAFPDDREGEIKVSIKKQDKELKLIIMDDGVGVPENFDWKNSKSLGLKLICTLVENQLDGSIDMESKNGTKFAIKFNIEA
ncbi:MAG: transporter substrate-binding domain-containing protein [Deltaproteobacteria bacterium]|jgi:PAS domain S-box-containing protein|nr:transporter substrate-binding domain-containing protein [Deltaproteobacteria bacterium]